MTYLYDDKATLSHGRIPLCEKMHDFVADTTLYSLHYTCEHLVWYRLANQCLK